MGLLDKLWDDVVAGPQPIRGLGILRKDSTAADGEKTAPAPALGRSISSPAAGAATATGIYIKPPPLIRGSSFGDEASGSAPSSPLASPSMPPGSARERENVWRSVFHPGSGRPKAMDRQGSARFDTVTPNSPSIYDWMYSPDNKPKYR